MTNKDFSHLNALQNRLFNEQQRLANAVDSKEIELRKVWVSQIEKEIAGEYAFLGVDQWTEESEISDEDLLAQLTGCGT